MQVSGNNQNKARDDQGATNGTVPRTQHPVPVVERPIFGVVHSSRAVAPVRDLEADQLPEKRHCACVCVCMTDLSPEQCHVRRTRKKKKGVLWRG